MDDLQAVLFPLLFYSPLCLPLAFVCGFFQFLLLYTAAAFTEDRVVLRLLGLPLPLLCLMVLFRFCGQLNWPVNWALTLWTDLSALYALLALWALVGCLAGAWLALHKAKRP